MIPEESIALLPPTHNRERPCLYTTSSQIRLKLESDTKKNTGRQNSTQPHSDISNRRNNYKLSKTHFNVELHFGSTRNVENTQKTHNYDATPTYRTRH